MRVGRNGQIRRVRAEELVRAENPRRLPTVMTEAEVKAVLSHLEGTPKPGQLRFEFRPSRSFGVRGNEDLEGDQSRSMGLRTPSAPLFMTCV